MRGQGEVSQAWGYHTAHSRKGERNACVCCLRPLRRGLTITLRKPYSEEGDKAIKGYEVGKLCHHI